MNIFKIISPKKTPQWMSLVLGLTFFCFSLSRIKAQDWPIGSKLPGMRLAVNPTQPLIALAKEQAITILDAKDWTTIHELPSAEALIADLEWSSDGQQLAVAAGYNIIIWQLDAANNSLQVSKTIAVADDPYDYDLGVTSIDWSPDQTSILGVNVPRSYIWDVSTGEVLNVYEQSSDQIVSAAWSPNGKMVAIGDIGGRLTLDHLDTHDVEIAHVPDDSAIFSLAWSPDSTGIAAGTILGYQNDRIQFFNVAPFLSTTIPMDTESAEVISLLWNPKHPNLLASGSFSGEAAIWNLYSGKLLQQVQTGNPVSSLGWSNDGDQLIYIQDDHIRSIKVRFPSTPSPQYPS